MFRQSELWSEIEQLDSVVAADTQTSMYLESRKMIERASRWFLRYRKRPLAVRATVEALQPGVDRITVVLPGLLCGSERDWYDDEDRRASRSSASRSTSPAGRRSLDALHTALDITYLAEAKGRPVEDVAALFCVVGNRLAIDWLRDRVVDLPRDDRWQALSRRALLEDIDAEHRRVTGSILATTDPGFEPVHAFEIWANGMRASLDRLLALVDDVRTHGVYDLATLSVVLREIRPLPCSLRSARVDLEDGRRAHAAAGAHAGDADAAAAAASSYIVVMIMRAPVAATGWPSEQPEPFDVRDLLAEAELRGTRRPAPTRTPR